MNIKEELLGVMRALNDAGIPYALCGGLALAVHGYPRATRDIDILISERDLEKVRETVRPLGFRLSSGIIPFRVGKPGEQRLFRVSKAEGSDLLTLDLMLVTPSLKEVWNHRELHEVEGEQIQVVGRAGLIQMKESAGRPQDLSDVENLKQLEENES